LKSFQGLASATLIGSMPHKDRDKAIGLILNSVPQIPVWPQLPIYPAEQMMAQYVEGLPGLVNEGGRQFVRTGTDEFEQECYHFYEQFIALEEGTGEIENSRFQMGPETGATFRYFLEVLSTGNLPLRALKGQIVGPFTLLSGLKDQDGRALIFDERFLDIIPKLLAYKAKWQIEFLKPFGVPVIIFLDEPALAGFGSSAFISISAELVRGILTEVVDSVKNAGALAGIHVCANTDWLLAFQSRFDIINFDAYNYFDKFALYRKECLEFLRRGGNIAWGVVPTSDLEAISSETPESLAERWTSQVREFASNDMSVAEILSQSLFTPGCGCGSLPEKAADRVLELLLGFSRIIGK
jgi:hypothetical protein